MRPRRLVAGTMVLAFAVAGTGCGPSSAPAPCLGDDAEVVSVPFQRLVTVSHELGDGFELARFAFDPAARGQATVSVQRATPPFIEFNVNEPIGVQGQQLWSVRIEGLVGGAATDRMRADVSETNQIREIVQVVDRGAFRWVVGTAAGSCVHLGADEETGIVVLHVATDPLATPPS